MLRQLHIRNFAVVEHVELEFRGGMTVMTGETGAGKSILVDALGLILGDRADTSVIRAECERAEISAGFDVDDTTDLRTLLDALDLEDPGTELLVRRVVGRDGRSRAYLNGSPVPVTSLREIGELMVDIHGQHAHQSLLKADARRQLLDDYGGHADALAVVRSAHADWQEAGRRLEQISGTDQDHSARLELLHYQVEELRVLAPREGEFESLDNEHRRLANAGRLMESLQQLVSMLYEDEQSVHSQLGRGVRELQELLRLDDGLAAARDLLDGAAIQLQEAIDAVRTHLDGTDLDPARLDEVEKRLEAWHETARKHHVRPPQLPAHLAQLQAQLDDLENASALVEELEQHRAAAEKAWAHGASALHDRRVDAANRMSAAVTTQLRELGMPDACFQATVEADTDSAPRAAGRDRVEFLVTVNPGQPARPLSKVASGGELSRISLAIQVVAAGDRGIPTLIFDEVDAGIGGGIAEIVGALLHRLALRRQVICVTHLPQVAAQGDHHVQVGKRSNRGSTTATATLLAGTDREEEIARMLGGIKISEKTRAHAREMLAGREKEKGEREKGKRRTR